MKYKTKLINGQLITGTYNELLELIKDSGCFHRYPITKIDNFINNPFK